MKSTICTLFEGHYHFGLAALVNSLYRNGYRGEIFAGYRGPLPTWCTNALQSDSSDWPGASTLNVADGLKLHFLPVSTSYHLTNYKPDFMLRLWEGPASGADSMVYFDPDIILINSWQLIEKWLKCGVALCEDVNSPIPENHPKRVAWREYYSDRDTVLKFKDSMYANGGFVGVLHQDKKFLTDWKMAQDQMAEAIGGLNNSALPGQGLSELDQSTFAPFGTTDQDALNVAVEISDLKISFVGQEGMAFKSGEPMLPHALGQPKPWKRVPTLQMLLGVSPRLVDKKYWEFSNAPIKVYPSWIVAMRELEISIAGMVGRFYRKK